MVIFVSISNNHTLKKISWAMILPLFKAYFFIIESLPKGLGI